MERIGKLSNIQVEIVKMFNYNLDNSQLLEIKDMLSNYFAKTTTLEMDTFLSENNLDENDIENWANEHLRQKR